MSQKAKVLVVDDDPDVVDQLTVALKAGGYEVHSAAGLGEAQELLLTVRPDVAILDLMMEQMDAGFVLCHHLKLLYPGTPTIILTSATSATGISFATSSADAQSWIQADKVMDKPVRAEQVRAEVRRLLGRKAAPKPAERHQP